MRKSNPKDMKHIRPQVRSSSRPTDSCAKLQADGDLDSMLEATRSSVDKWLGGTTSNEVTDNTNDSNRLQALEQQEEEIINREQKGILRKSKYKNKQHSTTAIQLPMKQMADLVIRNENEGAALVQVEDYTGNDESSELIVHEAVMAVKDLVVERQSPNARQTGEHHDALSVEGYTPKTDEKLATEATDEPMIFTSMDQLLKVAGTLTHDTNIRDAKVVEADLEFSVMSPDEYKQQMEDECELANELFKGHGNVFGSDDEDDDDSISASSNINTTDDEEELMDDDMQSDDDHLMEGHPGPEPRAFMKIWTALSTWLTPEAVAMLKHPSISKEAPIHTDIAASRCTGIMAMVNMHLPRARKELGIPEGDIKSVKRRVSDWLRCLDYSQQTHKLSTNLWRCMTVVLIDIVLSAHPTDLPHAASAVGMTNEEYRYLTQSAIKSLQQGSA